MSSFGKPNDCPIDLTVYNSNEIAQTNGEIEMYRIEGSEPKYVVLLGHNTTVELRSIGNFYNGFNLSPQPGLEPSLTPVSRNGSATRRQPSRTFRRTYIFLQRFTVSVAAGLAVRQLPKIVQKLVEHLPF